MTNISARMDYYRSIYHDEATSIHLATNWFAPERTDYHPPLYGYKTALRAVDSGVVHLSNAHDSRMGNCVQAGGAALLALETIHELPSWRVLQDAGLREARATRIDIAIDLFDENLTGSKIVFQLDSGLANTRFRTWQEVKGGGGDNGYTLYLGSRESAVQIRIYDKGAEQGLSLNWWRYEMVFNGVKAEDAWRTIRDLPDAPSLLPVAKAMMHSLIDFPKWSAWQGALGSTAGAEWTEIPRKDSDKWAWLMTQVAPTFTKQWGIDGDWRLLDAFVSALKRSET